MSQICDNPKMESTSKEVLIYQKSDGTRPYIEWLKGIRDRKVRFILDTRRDRLALGNVGYTNTLGDGVHELKVDIGPGYRIYFANDGNQIVVLLLGGDKSYQQSDIKKAKSKKLLERLSIPTGGNEMKKQPAIPLKEVLMDILEDEQGVCDYLNIALAENGPQGFLLALKNVIEARDYQMTQLATDSHLNRQNLYRMLSGKQSPRWENINALIETLGIKISFLPQEKKKAL